MQMPVPQQGPSQLGTFGVTSERTINWLMPEWRKLATFPKS
jgi:hypothetical protein